MLNCKTLDILILLIITFHLNYIDVIMNDMNARAGGELPLDGLAIYMVQRLIDTPVVAYSDLNHLLYAYVNLIKIVAFIIPKFLQSRRQPKGRRTLL